jgi:membrane-associated protease RseP (regulator of RpoE activity)
VHPTVILPIHLCDPAQVETLRWVFAHELTHLRRRDAWACLLFGLGQVVYFYVPWFWWLRRQVRLCQEYVADAAAAEQASRIEDYAQFLLNLTSAPAGPMLATGVRGNSSDLFRRITMLLQNPIRLEKHCPRRWSWTVAGGLLALAVLAAGIDPRTETTAQAAGEEPLPVVAQQPPSPPRPPVPATPAVPAVPGVEVDYLFRKVPRDNIDTEKFRKDLQEIIQRLRAGEQAKALELLQKQIDQLPVGHEEMKRRIIDLQRTLADRVQEHARPHDGRLGVAVEKPSAALIEQLELPKGQGLVIQQVMPDSAAGKAGLRVNDILLEMNGKPVPDEAPTFAKQLGEIKNNTPVDVVVVRKGKKETIRGLTLPGPKAPEHQPRVEVKIRGLPGAAAPPGLPLPIFGNRDGVMTTIFRSSTRHTTRHQEGSLIITVTGTVDGGKAKVNEVQVQDGQFANKYESVDQVPEVYRDKVKNLVDMSEKSSVKIEIKTP